MRSLRLCFVCQSRQVFPPLFWITANGFDGLRGPMDREIKCAVKTIPKSETCTNRSRQHKFSIDRNAKVPSLNRPSWRDRKDRGIEPSRIWKEGKAEKEIRERWGGGGKDWSRSLGRHSKVLREEKRHVLFLK